MKIQDILDLIEKVAPAANADEWDNVGLMCGRRNAKVTRALLCVDVTTDVIQEAVDKGCQVIVAHHPFLMEKFNLIDDLNVKGRQILTLTEHKIAVISAHTNADSSDSGMNDYLAKLLELDLPATSEHSRYLRIGTLATPTSVSELAQTIKAKLSLKNTFVLGNLTDVVARVGVYTGGVSVAELIAAKELFDIVVTGEFGYHKAIDLKEEGVRAILCGHYGSELLFTWWLREILEREMPELEVLIAERQGEPLTVV